MPRRLTIAALVALLLISAAPATAGTEYTGDHVYAMYPLFQAAANFCEPGEAPDMEAAATFEALMVHVALYGKYAPEDGEYEIREDGSVYISRDMLARMALDCLGTTGEVSLAASDSVAVEDGGYLIAVDSGVEYRNIEAYDWTRVAPLEYAVRFTLTDFDGTKYDGCLAVAENAASRFGFVLRGMTFTEGPAELTPFEYIVPEDGEYAGELIEVEEGDDGIFATVKLDSGYARLALPWYAEAIVTLEGAEKHYDGDRAFEPLSGWTGECALTVKDGQLDELRVDMDKTDN